MFRILVSVPRQKPGFISRVQQMYTVTKNTITVDKYPLVFVPLSYFVRNCEPRNRAHHDYHRFNQCASNRTARLLFSFSMLGSFRIVCCSATKHASGVFCATQDLITNRSIYLATQLQPQRQRVINDQPTDTHSSTTRWTKRNSKKCTASPASWSTSIWPSTRRATAAALP